MGLAMGSGLYEAAFATVVRLYGLEARRAITGITLFAGFASYLESVFGWCETCMVWALLHLTLGLPLNVLLPRAGPVAATPEADSAATVQASQSVATGNQPLRRPAFLMAYVFAVSWFISTAMAAHLPQLLQSSGAVLAVAIGAAALVGPA